MPLRTLILSAVVMCAALFAPGSADAFILSSIDPDPWLSTASGPRPGNGAPATITWSFVPDDTPVDRSPGVGTSPSNLISFMNTNFGGNPAQSDPTQQPWFHLFDDSFGRWEELGGVDFVYEPADDGMLLPSDDGNGSLGVRGDIRLGGYNVDGANGTLAFTYLPPFGSDMVVDTGDASFFSDATGNFLNFRDTLIHEIGHSFGLLHVESSSVLLMEPFIDPFIEASLDGPQLDEVRGVQFFFGDANEKSNGGLGNGVASLATNLGALAGGSILRVGGEADVPSQVISPAATDFVSVANLDDVDYYSFSVSQPSVLNAQLTPRGGIFTQAPEDESPTSFNANSRNNLALSLVSTNGTTVLATADANAAGVAESIDDLLLPAAGTYYARIAGGDDTIQLYELLLSAVALGSADYNGDGFVNAADYTVWRNTLGQSVAIGAGADGSGPSGVPDGIVDRLDYDFWKSHYGETAGGGTGQSANASLGGAVPEPAGLALGGLAIIGQIFLASAIRGRYNRRRVPTSQR